MNSDNTALIPVDQIVPSIFDTCGQLILLDCDLAAFLGVTTKQLHERIARSGMPIPADFMFELSVEQARALVAQFVSSDSGERPFAFTEHGALMAGMLLNTPRSLEVGVQVVRAFAQLQGEFRQWVVSNHGLALEIAQLERRVQGHDVIVDILQTFCDIMKTPGALHLSKEQREELNRQVEEYERTLDSGAPWPAVKERVLKRS